MVIEIIVEVFEHGVILVVEVDVIENDTQSLVSEDVTLLLLVGQAEAINFGVLLAMIRLGPAHAEREH